MLINSQHYKKSSHFFHHEESASCTLTSGHWNFKVAAKLPCPAGIIYLICEHNEKGDPMKGLKMTTKWNIVPTMLMVYLLCSPPSFASQHYSDLSPWCDDLVARLDMARQDATQAYAYGDYEAAVNILRDALHSAQWSGGMNMSRPLTAKAIHRGLEMLNILRTHSGIGARQAAFFLSAYARLIIQVARELDHSHYPHYYGPGPLHSHYGIDLPALERTYTRMAFRQLQLVLDNFSTSRDSEFIPWAPRNSFFA